jgi:hypothetical protein
MMCCTLSSTNRSIAKECAAHHGMGGQSTVALIGMAKKYHKALNTI